MLRLLISVFVSFLIFTPLLTAQPNQVANKSQVAFTNPNEDEEGELRKIVELANGSILVAGEYPSSSIEGFIANFDPDDPDMITWAKVVPSFVPIDLVPDPNGQGFWTAGGINKIVQMDINGKVTRSFELVDSKNHFLSINKIIPDGNFLHVIGTFTTLGGAGNGMFITKIDVSSGVQVTSYIGFTVTGFGLYDVVASTPDPFGNVWITTYDGNGNQHLYLKVLSNYSAVLGWSTPFSFLSPRQMKFNGNQEIIQLSGSTLNGNCTSNECAFYGEFDANDPKMVYTHNFNFPGSNEKIMTDFSMMNNQNLWSIGHEQDWFIREPLKPYTLDYTLGDTTAEYKNPSEFPGRYVSFTHPERDPDEIFIAASISIEFTEAAPMDHMALIRLNEAYLDTCTQVANMPVIADSIGLDSVQISMHNDSLDITTQGVSVNPTDADIEIEDFCHRLCDLDADMQVQKDPGDPLAVNLTNMSSGNPSPVRYRVDFGDSSIVMDTSGNMLSHTYSADGNYTITLVAYNDCGMDTVTHTVDIVTGVEPVPATSQFMVYPNPATEEVHIMLDKNLQNVSIRVMDVAGRTHSSQRLATINGQGALDISHLKTGYYLIEVRQDNQSLGFQKLFVSL